MKNIKKVRIKNFQSHQDTVIEFDGGFNVITGPSDEGKSAIIRALNWVFYNEPSGTDYIRVGASRCEVEVEFNTGYQVIRSRTPSNSRNRYELVAPEGEKTVFEKVGRDVPQEIINVHGMPKIDFDQDFKLNLNFDHQLGGPFLLNNSQANSAKVIGGLLDVHLVDSAIRDTSNDITTKKREEKQLEGRKEKLKDKLKEFEHLPTLVEEIEKKEKLMNNLKNIKSKLEKLKSYHGDLNKMDKKIDEYNKLNQKLKNLDKINDILTKLEDRKTRLVNLRELRSNFKDVTETKNKIQELLREVEEIEEVKDLVIRIQDKLENYHHLNQLKDQYQEHNKRIK